MLLEFTDAACSCPSGTALQYVAADLGGQVLSPGCYGADSFALTGTLALSGAGEYTFVAPTALNTAANSIVALRNDAQCQDVNWCIGTAATLGANSILLGALRADAAITIGANSKVFGSVLSGVDVITSGINIVIDQCEAHQPAALAADSVAFEYQTRSSCLASPSPLPSPSACPSSVD